jgi:hypothetical protein
MHLGSLSPLPEVPCLFGTSRSSVPCLACARHRQERRRGAHAESIELSTTDRSWRLTCCAGVHVDAVDVPNESSGARARPSSEGRRAAMSASEPRQSECLRVDRPILGLRGTWQKLHTDAATDRPGAAPKGRITLSAFGQRPLPRTRFRQGCANPLMINDLATETCYVHEGVHVHCEAGARHPLGSTGLHPEQQPDRRKHATTLRLRHEHRIDDACSCTCSGR